MALFAVLGTLAVSCQKETIEEPLAYEMETAGTYLITYSIDGVSQQVRLNSDTELADLLRRLTALAREGHKVSVQKTNAAGQASTKKVVTYRTTSEEDANEWAGKMLNEGCEVTIFYDDKTGEFVCIASN